MMQSPCKTSIIIGVSLGALRLQNMYVSHLSEA